jgi:dihydrofolate synthase / folylpolyglutamate synthase
LRFEEAVAELDGRQPEHMPGPSLARIARVATLLNDPQLTYPTIHVTGTNGKTTMARVAAAIGCGHGLRTGLFTSPHLISVRERISVCGDDIEPQAFADEYEHLLPYLQLVDAGEDGPVTYFEAVTALAFLWFADRPVALAVMEVGMGGGWDATNLVGGDVALIGPVALDHPELGDTVAKVATEKAGIIKAGKTVICREQDEDALAVIRGRCEEVGASLRYEHRDFEVTQRLRAVGGQAFEVRGLHGAYDELYLPLHGEHAARGAAAGIASVEALLGHELDVDATRAALAEVRSPGRLEVVERHPQVVLDGAHNPSGAQALAAALLESFTWDRLHLVVAVSANKDLAGIVRPLAPLADVVYAARNDSVRSFDADVVAAGFEDAGADAERFGSVADALAAARDAAGAGDLILVSGSLYTVADARRALGGS